MLLKTTPPFPNLIKCSERGNTTQHELARSKLGLRVDLEFVFLDKSLKHSQKEREECRARTLWGRCGGDVDSEYSAEHFADSEYSAEHFADSEYSAEHFADSEY
ncbi:hypothetical protein BgiMline_011712 [Biomphalaria glabrata]|nr:hypothetical protein BgiMline_029189 [Biomphalaria glabrata]